MAKKPKTKIHSSAEFDNSPPNVEITIGNEKDFNEIMLDAFDDAFSTLGEPIKKSIYFHIENSWGIKKHEIPLKINEFQNALEKIFGLGARNLEILCIRNIHSKIKTNYTWNIPNPTGKELTFQDYLQLVKTQLGETTENKGSKYEI